MNSCLYVGKVMHCRVEPKDYKFIHDVFMFYLDLDELDEIARNNWLISLNKPNVFSFYDKDHMNYGKSTLKDNVIHYIREKGVTAPISRVMLLTNLRVFGYVFNPVSFYYCFDDKDQPVCAIAQVCNTFGELKNYFLGPETFNENGFRSEQLKYYYISPFIDLDVPMDFDLKIPQELIKIKVDDLKENKKFLYATLTGKQRPLTAAQVFALGLRYPFMTLKVIALIHYHAAVLYYIKKIPYHKKQANLHLQKEVQREYVAK